MRKFIRRLGGNRGFAICVLILVFAVTGLFVFHTYASLTPEERAKRRYDQLMAQEILSISDLADRWSGAAWNYIECAIPDADCWTQTSGPLPFSPSGFSKDFLDKMIGYFEGASKVPVYEILIYQDRLSREIYFLNSDYESICVIKCPYGEYCADDAYAIERYPDLYKSKKYDEKEVEAIIAHLDPARVMLRVEMIPSDRLYDYLLDQTKGGDAEEEDNKDDGGEDVKSGGGSNDLWLSIEGPATRIESNEVKISIHLPTTYSFTSVVELFTFDASSNSSFKGVLSDPWVFRMSNAATAGTNQVVWIDANMIPENLELTRYYVAGAGDPDGDGLSAPAERYVHRTDPYIGDTDMDGVDDGTEVSEGTNPLDELPDSGLNRNWLFHNSFDYSSMTWELMPDHWRRFLMVDYETGTNSVLVTLPQNVALDTGGTVEVECYVSYNDPPGSENWTTIDPYPQGSFFTSIVVSSDSPFHGLPTLGAVTLDVYRVDWPQPPYTDEAVQVYYSPMVRTRTNGSQSDYTYLVKQLLTNDVGVEGYGANNWRYGAQYYAGSQHQRDYPLVHDRIRLRNGGFEQSGDDLEWTYSNFDAASSTNFAHDGADSFLSMDWGGYAYQNFVVYPGEELVLSGYMLTPSTNSMDPNPITEDRYGSMAIEYFDIPGGQPLLIQEAKLTNGSPHDTWRYFAITSLVPNMAQSANISLRTVSPRWTNGSGHVYFDNIQLIASADSDRDGIPDWWEVQYGASLDPNDPSDSIEDADSDGLLNIEEYRCHTDPTDADSDGDGIPDNWEVYYGLDPNYNADAGQDPDNDGLSNLQEYEAGTHPWYEDTDGDGLSDGMEVLDYGNDPLTPDFDGYDLVEELEGSNTVGRLGSWIAENDYLYAADRRGFVEYEFTAPTSDIYRIEIEGSDYNAYEGWRSYELRVSMDDVFLDRVLLSVEDNAPGTVGLYTPWATAGTHTVRFYWDNASSHKTLKVRWVRLQSLAGDDSDSDGVKDWVENRLARLSNVDTGQAVSVVSPYCLEGDDPYTEMMSLSGGVAVQHGAGDRWYADIPLSETDAVSTVVSFQDGGRIETNSIAWVAHNLLVGDDLTIRADDSVLFTADPGGATSGTVNIEVVGVTNYETNVGNPVSHLFNTTGTFTVTGTYTPDTGPSTNRTISVEVLSALFSTNPACGLGTIREWVCPDMSDEVSIEGDPNMQIGEGPPPDGGGRAFQAILNESEVHYMVARAGEKGAIITNAYAQGFRIGMGSDTYVTTKEICNTGDQLLETLIVLSPVFNDVALAGEIIVGGILYADGSVQSQWVATNFNELGECPVQFIRSAFSQTSYCNILDVYQGTNVVGRYAK